MWIDASKTNPPADGTWFLIWDRKHQWRDRPPVVAVRYTTIDATVVNDRDNNFYTNWSFWAPMPKGPG